MEALIESILNAIERLQNLKERRPQSFFDEFNKRESVARARLKCALHNLIAYCEETSTRLVSKRKSPEEFLKDLETFWSIVDYFLEIANSVGNKSGMELFSAEIPAEREKQEQIVRQLVREGWCFNLRCMSFIHNIVFEMHANLAPPVNAKDDIVNKVNFMGYLYAGMAGTKPRLVNAEYLDILDAAWRKKQDDKRPKLMQEGQEPEEEPIPFHSPEAVLPPAEEPPGLKYG